MLKALFKEPLVHFLALGLIVFAVYHLLNRSDQPEPDKIVVTQARIEQLAGLFAKTWQRLPTAAELKGLIDDYVKEEIFYREALTLGLDNDDTVIRRRLRLEHRRSTAGRHAQTVATAAIALGGLSSINVPDVVHSEHFRVVTPLEKRTS